MMRVAEILKVLVTCCFLCSVVANDIPSFEVEVYHEHLAFFTPVVNSVVVENNQTNRGLIIGGNWGIRIYNYGHQLEPVRVTVSSEDPARCLVGLFWDLSPPADILYKQQPAQEVQYTTTVPVCGEECYHDSQATRILCRMTGIVYFRIHIDLLGYGKGFTIYLKRECKESNLSYYGSDDWGHLFPPLGFLLYCTYLLLKTLELTFSVKKYFPKCLRRAVAKIGYMCNKTPAPETFAKDYTSVTYRELQREQILFVVLGFFLMLILSGDFPDKVAHGMFPKHFIFGAFVFLSGVLGLLLTSTILRAKSFPFVSPMVFIYLGLFFLWHEQFSYFAYFMHTVFGYLLVLFGILSGLRFIWPQLTLFFTFVGHFAAFVFIGTDNGLVIYLQPIITPPHFILFILNGVLIYMVTVVGIAYAILRWKGRVLESHVQLTNFSVENEEYNSDHEY